MCPLASSSGGGGAVGGSAAAASLPTAQQRSRSPQVLTCSRPFVLSSSGRVCTATGEVAASSAAIPVACGSRWQDRCETCSDTYRKRTHLVIASGLPRPGDGGVAVLATLTAPSFGQVHRAARPKKARRTRVCGCGEFHDVTRHRGLIGSPLDAGSYDYAGAVRWNESAPLLWNAFRHRLLRAADALGVDVEMCRIAEPQRRGAVHFHALLVFRPVDGEAFPSSADLREFVADLLPTPLRRRAELERTLGAAAAADHINHGPTATAPDGTVLRFGSESDARVLRPRRGADGVVGWGAVSGYLAKYLTKSLGGADLADPVPHGSPVAVHLDRLGSIAAKRATYRAARRGVGRSGDITRARRGCGFAGAPRASSQGWGTTLAELKREAHRVRLVSLGLDPLAVPDFVELWEYDQAKTERLRLELQAEGLAAAG